jgi:hypothetical protein
MSLGRILVLAGLLALSVESRAQTGAPSIEVDFAVPSGYVAQHEGGLLWMLPHNGRDARTPCIYGLAPPRPSRGSLEVDAEAALVETVAVGWPRITDERIALRGVAAAGWPYFLSGGEFRGTIAGEIRSLAVMALVFPAPAHRVNVVFGLGSLGACRFDDVPFAQLFHSLRPRGWPNPASNALARDLIGTWEGRGLSQHTFLTDGRYSRSTAGVLHDRTISGEGDGRYALRGAEITITPRVVGQAPERFRVYIYDKWNNRRWQRAMSVLYDDSRPPYVAEYVRAAQ